MSKRYFLFFLILSAFLILIPLIFAVAPTGPDSITVKDSSRRNDFNNSAAQIQAQAGNLTELNIHISQISNRWQAYYGNITGTITLDDGNKNTIYDWSDPAVSVVGNIFAANSTVNGWGSIRCVNLTANGNISLGNELGGGINQTIVNRFYNATETAVDNIQNTFNSSLSVIINGNTLTGCPGTHTYANNATQTARWNETLLTINATSNIIFATTIEQNSVGYDGRRWDFQMIVMENGADSATTPYYFYVELT